MAAKRARKRYHVSVNRDWCKGCAICSAFCPAKVLGIDGQDTAVVLDAEACTGCRLCELRCPDFAIEVRDESAAVTGKAVTAEVDLEPSGGAVADLERDGGGETDD